MALVIEGGSKCKICNKIIENLSNLYMVPAIDIINELDPLSKFSDSVLHLECLKKCSIGNELTSLVDEWLEKTESHNFKCSECSECNEEISDPDDYFHIGFLTSDKNHPLLKFNFLHFHKSHIENWEDRSEFLGWLKLYKEKDGWQGALLDQLIEIMSACPEKLNQEKWKNPLKS